MGEADQAGRDDARPHLEDAQPAAEVATVSPEDARTGGDYVVDALETYGVEHVFGNPGTTELPLMDALSRSDEIEYVLGLHEDVAVGMAGGYASTRRYHAHHDPEVNPAGFVNLHIAPGLAHGLGNIYAAWIAGAPLVVTAGNTGTDFRHEEPILSGDLVEMTDQFTKWSDEVLDVSALPTMLRRAFRTALTPPTGPVFLALPLDVTLAEIDAEPEPLGPIPDAGAGDQAQIDLAADYLAAADNPRLIVGDLVARAGTDAVEAAVDLAEAAEMGVYGEMLSYEINFPTEHDHWVDFIPPVEGFGQMMMATDTLVFAGCSTHTTLTSYEEPLVDPDTTCIHLGPDAWELGKNYDVDAAIVGDPGTVMAELAERVDERLDEDARAAHAEALAAELEDFGGGPDPAEGGPDERATKGGLVEELHAVVPEAYIVDESITAKYQMLQRWDFEPEGAIGNKGGGLGYGLPASIGAAIAEDMRPAPRPTIGFVGDGSYLYYPHSLYSAARHDVDVTVVIPDNRNYRILKDNTLNMLGGEEGDYDFVGMDFEPPVDIVANAESHGAQAHLAETRAEIGPAVETALATDGPVVVDALVRD